MKLSMEEITYILLGVIAFFSLLITGEIAKVTGSLLANLLVGVSLTLYAYDYFIRKMKNRKQDLAYFGKANFVNSLFLFGVTLAKFFINGAVAIVGLYNLFFVVNANGWLLPAFVLVPALSLIGIVLILIPQFADYTLPRLRQALK